MTVSGSERQKAMSVLIDVCQKTSQFVF